MNDKRPVKMEKWNPNEDSEKTQKPIPQTNIPHEAKQDVVQNSAKPEDGIYEVIKDLPTKYKLYPKGTQIKARPMKVIEVKSLSNMNGENANDVVDNILEKTLRGINVDDIYTADKLYILFWLRVNTFNGSDYFVKFDCKECKTKSNYEFSLNDLNMKILTDDDVNKLNEEVVLPNGHKITFGLRTIKDEKDILKFIETNKNSLMSFDEEFVTICKMIKSINGKNKSMLEKYIYITEELDSPNYASLETHLENASVGLEPNLKVKCNKCGGTSITEVPFRPDFFLPRANIK